MILAGALLLILGYLLGLPILEALGAVLLIVGVILLLLGSVGRPVGGRRHYW
ncbi:MAG: hypothetical protein QOE19_3279 [Actinomycetota bacterium]|jgi:hypothetical protein|nr:hypothetical protein [Actinomycetota bacterium]MDQ1664459.1 hypothetical protein [Actinomycetota bacterium]MDQ1670871.1 hypothetical protein [Actinomycetota bacterium]